MSFAAKQGTQIIMELLEEAGAALKDVDWFIVHQANINIIEDDRFGLRRFEREVHYQSRQVWKHCQRFGLSCAG